jgi:L-2-hydroxyglutarate oxidase LhgO
MYNLFKLQRFNEKGVHATIDLNRNTRFGPDVEWLDPDSETCLLDFNVDEQRAESFYGEIRRYWPGLKDGALQPDYSGIRPKLGHVDVKRNGLVNSDFYIKGKHQHGIKGLVHMLGMESPGLTSSLAIADHAIKILTEDGCL